ncbi:hypothetical protein PVT67_18270 [Gallaecimonas kandeliae]|uniref:hypothetical protein n=1 Tax=Gallaecimonas kandeliae TaxID=3029055 RepID=UPI002649891F|nr:hypothetical protein [Gallaecimonas kandeliae]WKE65583.1 hypothetical protein PVT67_18270 [Gallaecimonas kandeliae]
MQFDTAVIGAGWLGLPLAKALRDKGNKILVTRRSQAGCAELAELGLAVVALDLTENNDLGVLAQCRQLVLAFPPGIRRGKGEDYLKMLQRLRDGLAGSAVQNMLLVSSSGALAEQEAELDETSPADPASPLAQAEQQLLADPRYSASVIRMAGLFGPGRYPGRFLAGKRDLERGAAPVNLIHQADAVGLCLAVLERQAWGQIFHGVAPVAYRRDHFYGEAARLAGLAEPHFVDQKGGKRVLGDWTAALLGYQYQVPDPLAWCQGAVSGVEC